MCIRQHTGVFTLATLPCVFSTFARAASYNCSFSSSAVGHSSLAVPDRGACGCCCGGGDSAGKLVIVNLEELGLRPVMLVKLVLVLGRTPNSSGPLLLAFDAEGLCAGRTPKPRPAPYPMSSALPSGRVLDCGEEVTETGGRWIGRVDTFGACSTLIV